jgi:hypothetical protein
MSVSYPRKVRRSLFFPPPSAGDRDVSDNVDNSHRVFVRTGDAGEGIQLLAHCQWSAKLLCLIINACDLSNATAGIEGILELLVYCVSEEHSLCEHPEYNIKLLVSVFRDWLLCMLQISSDTCASMLSHSRAGDLIVELLKVRLSLSFSLSACLPACLPVCLSIDIHISVCVYVYVCMCRIRFLPSGVPGAGEGGACLLFLSTSPMEMAALIFIMYSLLTPNAVSWQPQDCAV